jgi:RimJ/RimL family protein N-acetyltransferase
MFKKAEIKDIPVIQELATKIWNDHYVPIIGRAQVDYMLGKMYSPQALHEQMTSGQQFVLLEMENKPTGFLSFTENPDKKFFIHKFYIQKVRQGRGIGKAAFDKWLFENNANEVTLTVNRKNYKSINFYFKCGFVINRVLDIDIGNGYFMNDFEMIWKKRM